MTKNHARSVLWQCKTSWAFFLDSFRNVSNTCQVDSAKAAKPIGIIENVYVCKGLRRYYQCCSQRVQHTSCLTQKLENKREAVREFKPFSKVPGLHGGKILLGRALEASMQSSGNTMYCMGWVKGQKNGASRHKSESI